MVTNGYAERRQQLGAFQEHFVMVWPVLALSVQDRPNLIGIRSEFLHE